MITAPGRSSRVRSVARALASWPTTRRGRAFALLLAMLLVDVLLLAPQWAAPGSVPFRWIAAEAVFLVLIFAALPRRPWSLALAGAAAVLVLLAALTAVGDATIR